MSPALLIQIAEEKKSRMEEIIWSEIWWMVIMFCFAWNPTWGLDGWTKSGVEEFPAHWVGNADPRTLQK